MKVLQQIIQIFALVLVANISLANSTPGVNNSIFDQFSFQEMLEIDLNLNMEEVFGNRKKYVDVFLIS